MIDIYHSRRTQHKLCKYWVRDESITDIAKWILTKKPKGIFYAQEQQVLNRTKNQISNVVMYDQNNVNIYTNDEVPELTKGCVVLYLGHPWIVVSVQAESHLRESQFGEDRTTYISLQR